MGHEKRFVDVHLEWTINQGNIMKFKENLQLHAKKLDEATAAFVKSFDYNRFYEDTKFKNLQFAEGLFLSERVYGFDYSVPLLCCHSVEDHYFKIDEKRPPVMYYFGVFGSFAHRLELHRYPENQPMQRHVYYVHVEGLAEEADRNKQISMVCQALHRPDANQFETFNPLHELVTAK